MELSPCRSGRGTCELLDAGKTGRLVLVELTANDLGGVPLATCATLPPPLTVRQRPWRVPAGTRLTAGVIAAGCLVILILAALLTPSPEGYGSHIGAPLHLQACAFLERTGLPCPACGMTTSFCWFVRGNLVASLYVQPMGAVLAAIACLCVWCGFYVILTGKPIYRLLGLLPGLYYTIPLLTIALLAWGWKILIHVNGLDGWR